MYNKLFWQRNVKCRVTSEMCRPQTPPLVERIPHGFWQSMDGCGIFFDSMWMQMCRQFGNTYTKYQIPNTVPDALHAVLNRWSCVYSERTVCVFNHIALSTNYHCYSFNKFASGYVKCMKVFFGLDKFSSVSNMLMELGLPSWSKVMHNTKSTFVNRLLSCSNKLIQVIIRWVSV